MASLLDSVLEQSVGGLRIISEQNDRNAINWVRGMSDPGEMIACGAYQQLRRLAGESDTVYQSRIEKLLEALPAADAQKIRLAGATAAITRARLSISPDGKIAMVSALVVPWHALGKVVSQAMTSKEACTLGELANWNLQKLQQYVDFNDQRLLTDMWAIVRGDNGKVLGSVGERYKIVTNEECFDFMDSVIKGGAKFQTAGAIGNGEKTWMLADMPQRANVKGDTLESYILCTTTHDGSGAVWVYPTGVRVECNNTMRLASRDRSKGLHMKHTVNVGAKVQAAKEILGLSKVEFDRFADKANFLVSKQVEPAEYFAACLDNILDVTVAEQKVTQANIRNGSVLDAILGIGDAEAKATAEATLDRVLVRRTNLLNDIVERYESPRNNNERIGGTGWAAFNAVTEHLDHSTLHRYNGDSERRFEQVLTGQADQQKQVALNLAVQAASAV